MSFLLNCWYAAAYGDEIGDQPLARTLLGIPVALYRLVDGGVAALEDRCPHRFAPLSKGKVVGQEIQCPYHGLRFASDGACAYNPHYDHLPQAARVRSFPVHERYGVAWFWPGEPDLADPSRLPDFGFLERTDYRTVAGYLNVKASYQLIVDNLLDLTHTPYLHPAFAAPGVSTEERLRNTKTEFLRGKDWLVSKRWRLDSPPNAPTRHVFGFQNERMDSRFHMHWFPPALLYFDLGAAPVDGPEAEGLCIPAMHAITPETELTSHYFFAQARNVLCEDAGVDAKVFDMLDTAFRAEDEPMIEAQQANMGETTEIADLGPVMLKTDAAPVAARRMLKGLIEAEAASAAVAA